MDSRKAPFIRLLLVVLVFSMLFYMPVREFLKITFILGIPVIFLLRYMVRQKKYSITWIASLTVLFFILTGYGFLLTQLPERIETRRIITEGEILVAEGKYNEAVEEYKKLEKLGRIEKMNDKITEAQKEKKASYLLNQAKELIEEGDSEQAEKILDSISTDTRAAREASRLKKSIAE